jgi:hypothetical protein
MTIVTQKLSLPVFPSLVNFLYVAELAMMRIQYNREVNDNLYKAPFIIWFAVV